MSFRPMLFRAALACAALALAACDAPTAPDPLVFGGVEVVARGDAALAIVDGALVVSGLDGARAGGFAVDGNPQRLDVVTDPVTLGAGGSFGVTVESAAGALLASMANEADTAGGADRGTLRFAFPDGVPAARITYRLAGATVFEIPSIDLTPAPGQGAQPAGRRSQQGSAGASEGKSGSVHVIRNADGQYIVVSDAEGSAKRGGGPCLGFTITPPVRLPVETFPDGRLCADWVEVAPLLGPATPSLPPAARAAVVARGVGSFRVRSLVVAR